MSKIAFLGTGTMGLPIARNLAQADFEVRAWNRHIDRARPLSEDGATVCEDAAEAAQDADFMITMLSDADAVLESATAAIGQLGKDAIWIQMGTIGVDGTDRCAELANEHGVELVDAPVLGTKQPAEQGKLIIVAGGSDSALEACAPIFDVVGSKTVTFPKVGDGSRCKLVANAWLLALSTALAETIDLANVLEIDPSAFLEAIAGGAVDCQYAQLKGPKMIEQDFSEVSFRLAMARKDADLVREQAERHGLKAPVLEATAERLGRAASAGHEDEDMAALFLGRPT